MPRPANPPLVRHPILPLLLLLAGSASAADCTPTTAAPVCAFSDGPGTITLRVLLPSPDVKCLQVRSRAPKARYEVLTDLQVQAPVTSRKFGNLAPGEHRFVVNHQFLNKNAKACLPPYLGLGFAQVSAGT